MVAFLTTWSLIDGLARAWRDMSGLSELLNNAGEENGGFDPGVATVAANGNDLLSRRMSVLGLDDGEVARMEPGIFYELNRACVFCGSRAQCDTDLNCPPREDENSDAEDWRDYCPNVATLNMLSSLFAARRAMGQCAA